MQPCTSQLLRPQRLPSSMPQQQTPVSFCSSSVHKLQLRAPSGSSCLAQTLSSVSRCSNGSTCTATRLWSSSIHSAAVVRSVQQSQQHARQHVQQHQQRALLDQQHQHKQQQRRVRCHVARSKSASGGPMAQAAVSKGSLLTSLSQLHAFQQLVNLLLCHRFPPKFCSYLFESMSIGLNPCPIQERKQSVLCQAG